MKIKQKILILAGIVLLGTTVVASSMPAYAASASCSTAILPKSLCSGNGDANIMGILVLVINILTAGVGIAAVGGILWAAFIYVTAEANPAQVTKAKLLITNVVVGIVAYFLMYALLNFLIPGGLLK